jgi:hypothetical protein
MYVVIFVKVIVCNCKTIFPSYCIDIFTIYPGTTLYIPDSNGPFVTSNKIGKQIEFQYGSSIRSVHYIKLHEHKLHILLYVPRILYSLLFRPTNAQHIYKHYMTYSKYSYMFRCTCIFFRESYPSTLLKKNH